MIPSRSFRGTFLREEPGPDNVRQLVFQPRAGEPPSREGRFLSTKPLALPPGEITIPASEVDLEPLDPKSIDHMVDGYYDPPAGTECTVWVDGWYARDKGW